MGLVVKLLKVGTLPTTLATLYPGDSVVTGKGAIVKNIILTNKHASTTATVNLYVSQTTSTPDYRITPVNVQIPAGMQLIIDTEIALQLNTGPDRIKGVVSGVGSSDVDYVINGMERDN